MKKVALVGYGYWGPNLARNFSELATLSLVCDLDKAKLDKFHVLYPNIRVTTKFEDVLKSDADAVAIATQPSTHYLLAKQVLEANKHVFVEKPLALKSKDAKELADLAKAKKKILMVGHTFEYNPSVVKVKEIIDSGELGEIYYVYGQRLNLGLWQPDCNVVWDLAPHDLSILFYWLNKEPKTISCQAKAHVQKGKEDVAFITLNFDGGKIAHLHVSWLDPAKVRKMVVVGSKKMLIFDDIREGETVRIIERAAKVHGEAKTFQEFKMSYHQGETRVIPIDKKEPLKQACRHFIDCIENGRQPKSNGASGLRVVKALEAIDRSIRQQGKEVPVSDKGSNL